MLCFVCGLDVAKIEIVSKRGEICFICSKCDSKQEKSIKKEDDKND